MLFNFRVHQSFLYTMIVMINIMADMTICQKEFTPTILRPLVIMTIMIVPSTLPVMEPEPPLREVPPITIAVMLSIFHVAPMEGCPLPMRLVMIMPAILAQIPERIYEMIMIIRTLMPESSATISLPPIA